ncbi:aliphatic sulfonate ABC transporter substrate-binding protein [Lichenicola sp.]|uniref:aliphatic sulfonate ABC transporter substrate-binding protein n=1 Tax=Lichenicola sp. TaxID=2804529 RepID=UPI003AFF9F8C
MSTTRRSLLLQAGLSMAALSLAGIGRARGAAPRTIRIGYQRYGTLIILKHTGTLEVELAKTGDRVAWSEFPAGPQMLQAMGAGAIDFGITGDAPPIFAQAASNRIVYIAAEPKAPYGEAIIVPKTSTIKDVAGLRGKTVALNRASNVHWLLLAALSKAGLTMADIKPVFLTPGSARPAFDSGRLDAWAIWDPYLSSVQTASDPRVIASAGDLVGNRQFFLADRHFADANPDLIRLLMAQVNRSDAWSEAHKDQVSQYLASDTGLPVPVVRKAVDRLTFGALPLTPDVVAEQQAIADAFLAQHLIPGRLTVQDAVWKLPA